LALLRRRAACVDGLWLQPPGPGARHEHRRQPIRNGAAGVVLTALRRLRDEFASTVVVITHSPRVAEAADRMTEIRDGVAT